MAIKTQKIVADFETTTTPDDVRVWGVCAVDIDTLKTVYLGNNLEEFMEWLKDKNTTCYFHNARFDLEFILPYLLKNGYKHAQVKNGVAHPKKQGKFKEKPKAGTFDTLITDDGVVYSTTVYFKELNKKWLKVTFLDSLKKLPFKVSKISKDFGLPDEKLKIDYNAPRPVGHVLTPEEEAYIINDCRIVADALKIQIEKGLTKMTNAGDAMAAYKTSVAGNFDYWFPELPLELDDFLRKSYKGGFVYLNPKYQNIRGLKGRAYDVNSLYPSCMYNKLLPYGYPMRFEGKPEEDDKYPLYIVYMECTFTLKEGHLPCIQLKNSNRFVQTEYLSTSETEDHLDEPVKMWLTSVDHQLILDHYVLENVTYHYGYKFKGMKGMFKEYIDYWMHIKETSTGALRTLAKLQLNSLYGRFALNPKAFEKVPRLDPDGVVRYDVVNDDYCKKHEIPLPERRSPVYTALASFITAFARETTVRAAQNVYDRFIYADTDSLKLEGMEVPEGLDIHPTKLGCWKDEGQFIDSVFLRAKTYMASVETTKEDTLENYAKLLTNPFTDWVYRESGGIRASVRTVTCAGMPENVKEFANYDTFQPGETFHGKLMPRRFPGGVVLTETTFTLK